MNLLSDIKRTVGSIKSSGRSSGNSGSSRHSGRSNSRASSQRGLHSKHSSRQSDTGISTREGRKSGKEIGWDEIAQRGENINTKEFVSSQSGLQKLVHHYMPSRFPYAQSICQVDVQNFRTLWLIIAEDKKVDAKGKSKLSTLFDIFYHNLFARSAKFREYFGSDFKERCRILTRQLNFFTTLRINDNIESVFQDLGILHQKLGISNWQYSLFAEVLIESIATVLGDQADMVKMMSATRVTSFALYMLLKHTLNTNNLIADELNVNHNTTAPENKLQSSD